MRRGKWLYYQWMSIYSSREPYGNRGKISIALASIGKGWVTEEGEAINKGEGGAIGVTMYRTMKRLNEIIAESKEASGVM